MARPFPWLRTSRGPAGFPCRLRRMTVSSSTWTRWVERGSGICQRGSRWVVEVMELSRRVRPLAQPIESPGRPGRGIAGSRSGDLHRPAAAGRLAGGVDDGHDGADAFRRDRQRFPAADGGGHVLVVGAPAAGHRLEHSSTGRPSRWRHRRGQLPRSSSRAESMSPATMAGSCGSSPSFTRAPSVPRTYQRGMGSGRWRR